MDSDGTGYSATIGTFEADDTIEFYISASDHFDNIVETDVFSFAIGTEEDKLPEIPEFNFSSVVFISLTICIISLLTHRYIDRKKKIAQ